jgi:molybdopterin-guanine dinucleotide biosynthesis protein A
VPVVGGYEEPLHALYHRRCLPAIETRLAQGQRRVISFLGDVRTRYVSEEDLRAVDPQLHSFVNANTPAEWDAALQLLISEPQIAQKRCASRGLYEICVICG